MPPTPPARALTLCFFAALLTACGANSPSANEDATPEAACWQQCYEDCERFARDYRHSCALSCHNDCAIFNAAMDDIKAGRVRTLTDGDDNAP